MDIDRKGNGYRWEGNKKNQIAGKSEPPELSLIVRLQLNQC